jgi:peptide/nickel transport system ATP-binding protein
MDTPDLLPDLLQVRDLSISFGTEAGEAHVLDGVNLDIREGEIMGLVGESGCGKTTLARAVLGILPPNARRRGGSIGFRGDNVLTWSGERFDREVRGRRITFIPQDPYSSLNPLFKVGSQMMELMKWKSPRRDDWGTGRGLSAFATRYPRSRRKADREAILDMLRAVQIPQPESIFSKLPSEYSGGQRQRLMIAMALLPEPDLVIADEPTTALDVTIQAQILKLLRALARDRGVSILLTTHDLGAAYEICDRITVMYAGQEVETAPVDAFFDRSSHRYTRRLLESLPDPKRTFKGIGGEVPALVDPPPGCRFHPRCSHAVEPCSQARPEVTVLGRGHEVRCYNPEIDGVEDTAASRHVVES